MKKFWSLICCVGVLLSLSACGSMEEDSSSLDSSLVSSQEASENSSSEAPHSSIAASSKEQSSSSSESPSSSEPEDLVSEEEVKAIQDFLRLSSLEGEEIAENNASDAALAMAGYQLTVQKARQLSDGEYGIEKSVFEQSIRDYFGYSIRDPQGLSIENSPIYYQDGYYRWYGFGIQSGCSTTVRSAKKLEDRRYEVETDADFYELNENGTRTELGVAKGHYIVEVAPDSPYGFHLISQQFTDLPV